MHHGLFRGSRGCHGFSTVEIAITLGNCVPLLCLQRGKGGDVFSGGIEHPGLATTGTKDGYGEAAWFPAGNSRGIDKEMDVGIAFRAPRAFSAWLVSVARDVAV